LELLTGRLSKRLATVVFDWMTSQILPPSNRARAQACIAPIAIARGDVKRVVFAV
jgi:hypothetical protein